jgi:ferric-dicitrate binding protein FerR (iron transport regulator)
MNEDERLAKDEGDDVATLVRLAGWRRAVPPERTERVRAAALACWQQELRGRSRRLRYVWAAGVALAAAASIVLVVSFRALPVRPSGSTESGAMARVESMSGAIWARDTSAAARSARRPLSTGDEIPLGSELVTAPDGRAALRLDSGHSLRLDTGSRVRLLAEDAIALDAGAIYVDSAPERPAEIALAVHTPLGVVREIGTQFEVRLAPDSVRVRLRDGAVAVSHDGGELEVRAGNELQLSAGGLVTRQAVATHGPGWDWMVGVTPMLDLEGRTARAFLDWVARERGWTLAFADESAARAAGEVVLGGGAEGLSLDQALDAVLATCRMTYRVEGGVLRISSAGVAPGRPGIRQ